MIKWPDTLYVILNPLERGEDAHVININLHFLCIEAKREE